VNHLIFKAYAVTTEIDLNKIAAQCGIPKKYTWEEPLVIREQSLAGILGHAPESSQMIFVFAFGSLVFINSPIRDEQTFLEYLTTLKPDLVTRNFRQYNDDYELRESGTVPSAPGDSSVFTDQYAVVPRIETYHPELISTVIAKSVALEKTEEQMEKILDLLEGMIDRLEKAKLKISDRELATTTARIIRHEYNTIAYIMILDKPDITWTNSEAAAFYDQMSHFFELSDRYEILKQKTDILNVIIDNFSSISHSLRGLFIEWLIVILILAELVLMLLDLLK
jgi:uncharacterized Rmd1/YagE family protein